MRLENEKLDQIWTDLEALSAFAALTQTGHSYLRSALYDGPSRPVGSGLFSNSGELTEKGGLRVGFDSEECEGTYAKFCYLDDTILLLDQPPRLKVFAHDSRGRQQNRSQTPDYLRVSNDQISLVEAKKQAELEEKRKRYPNDWIRERDNLWRYLPGENAAHLMGMTYQVFCPEQYSPQYRANLGYLVELKKSSCDPLSGRVAKRIREALKRRPLSIEQILESYSAVNADQLISMILNKELYGLLEHQSIGMDFIVYGTLEQAELAKAELHAYRTQNVQEGTYAHRLLLATPKQREYAESRTQAYKERRAKNIRMNSTDFAHRKKMEAAVAEGAPAMAGLIPRFSDRGGIGTPLSQVEQEWLEEFLTDYMKKLRRIPSPSEAHAELTVMNEGTDRRIPSEETIRKYIAKLFKPERQASLCGGPRAIQKSRAKTPGEKCIERVRVGGMWAHCDAVYADVRAKDDDGIWKIARPIVFPLVICPSLYIASAGITFGSASSLGYFMSIRLCMLDHGWVPLVIVRDKGSEFANQVDRELSAHFDITRVCRPTAYSRGGGEVECVNGQLNAFLQTLSGGMFHDQAGRDADAIRKSRSTAIHDLQRIVIEILDWIDRWNNTVHAGCTLTPKEQFERDMESFPCSVRKVALDDNARYVTSYPIGVEKFTYERGAVFAGKKYSGDIASQLIHHGETPQKLRLDCFDPSIIWGQSSRGLVRLTSNEHNRIAGMGRVARILTMAERMRYHIVSKANQAEYRRRNAKRRVELEEAARAKGQPTAEKVASSCAGEKASPAAKGSFSKFATGPRPALRIVGGGG
jgi:hypothetical protein